jgi:hypothetical protein
MFIARMIVFFKHGFLAFRTRPDHFLQMGIRSLIHNPSLNGVFFFDETVTVAAIKKRLYVTIAVFYSFLK